MLTLVMRVQDNASAELSRIQKVTKLFGGTVQNTTGQLQKFTRRFFQVTRALVSFLIVRTATVQLAKFFKELLRGNEVLERATTSISRLVGSLGVAQKKIDYIRALAMRAPFDYESILKSSVLLIAYGRDIEKFLPRLLDWAAGMGKTSGELEGYAAAMGKILAQSPHVKRLLQARGIDLATWNQALAEVNQELPKAARFEQALMIVTQRFEGQADALAKTLYGLKTNIHDVWVEMQREIGLAMFVKVRTALFDLYSDMRDVIDTQREMLWDIGDAIGSWVGNLIMFIKELPKLAGPLRAILQMVKYLAVFLIGRSLVASLMTAVQWVLTLTANFNAAAVAAGAISVAVALIAMQLVKAKMKALDLKQELDAFKSFVRLLDDFAQREEQIFQRGELYHVNDQIEKLDIAIAALGKNLPTFWKELSWGADKGADAVALLESQFLHAKEAVDVLGASEEDLLLLWDLEEKIEAHRHTWEGGVFKMSVPVWFRGDLVKARKDLAALLGGVRLYAMGWRDVHNENYAASKANEEVHRKETEALNSINTALEMWKQGLGGVAEYQWVTLQHVQDVVAAEREFILSLKGTGELMRIEAGLDDHMLATEKDRLEVVRERYALATRTAGQTQAVAEAEFALGGSPHDLLATYKELIDFTKGMQMTPGWDKDEMDALILRMYELLQLYQDLVIATDEIAAAEERAAAAREEAEFEAWAAKWQQALAPIGNAISQMAFDMKNMGKYAAQAFKQMIQWAIRLSVQYLILAILRAIWDPGAIKGGMNVFAQFGSLGDFTGAPKIKAADGFRGMVNQPTFFMAGEEGPEFVSVTPQGGSRAGGGGVTIIGDVYGWDDFVDKVQSANMDITLATGGEG
jgi:hypothetical protein